MKKICPFGAIFAICLAAATVLWFLADSTLLAQSTDDSLTTDESLTISGITVELSESVKTAKGIDIGHTFRTGNADMVLHPIGVPEIRSGETVVRARKGVVGGRGNFTTSIPWDTAKAKHTNVADVDLGSFVVSKPNISGSSRISLGADYGASIATESSSASILLNANLDVSGRRYLVSKMTLFGNENGAGFSSFSLTLSPKNDAAKRTEIASGGVADVALTDDRGNSYQWTRTRTNWNKDTNSRTVAWQQLSFDGAPPSTASTLTLSVTGGGEVVGPLVFEDVRLVSGDGK